MSLGQIRFWIARLALLVCCVPISCSGSGGSEQGNQSQTGGASNTAASGGSSGTYANAIPLGTTFETTTDGAAAGDAQYAFAYCGDVANPSSLKPTGTVVRVAQSLRYFVCTGDLGSHSADLIQTNIPSDPVQGFVPYAAFFTYEDTAHPNTQQPNKGPLNYALLVINLLNDDPQSSANSSCSGSNNVFSGTRIGGATKGLCGNEKAQFREQNGKKYVDVTFPSGQAQSFVLQKVPFDPPSAS